MPKIDVSVPHSLSTEEATNRIKKMISSLQTQFAGRVHNVKENWKGSNAEFSFDFMGFSVSGTLEVQPAQLTLRSDLPLAATPFKGRIETAIRDKARELLA